MNPYEVMFIVNPNVEGDDAVDAQIERFGRLVVDRGGQVTAVDKWGKRRFAYEIEGLTEGYYVVMQFKADNSAVDELSRVMRIADEVVRHMVVRLDESQLKTAQPAARQEAQAPAQTAESAPASDAPGEAEGAGDATGPEPDSAAGDGAAEATEVAEASTTASNVE